MIRADAQIDTCILDWVTTSKDKSQGLLKQLRFASLRHFTVHGMNRDDDDDDDEEEEEEEEEDRDDGDDGDDNDGHDDDDDGGDGGDGGDGANADGDVDC